MHHLSPLTQLEPVHYNALFRPLMATALILCFFAGIARYLRIREELAAPLLIVAVALAVIAVGVGFLNGF